MPTKKTKSISLMVCIMALNFLSLSAQIRPTITYPESEGLFTTLSKQARQEQLHLTFNAESRLTIPNWIYSLYKNIPAFGVYGEPYELKKRLISIELNQHFYQHIPQSLINELASLLKTTTTDLATIITQNNIALDFFVAVNGTFENPSITNQKPLINTLFHGFLAQHYNNDAEYTMQKNILMGIFSIQGLSDSANSNNNDANRMPINAMIARDVHSHDERCSPNNNKIQPNAPISSFWSIALHDNACAITFNILINDAEIGQQCVNAIKNNKQGDQLNFEQFIQDIHNIHPDLRILEQYLAQ
ncbi:MAG: hypothetical protein US69_C0007G0003 [candidate division TM6 bacterium GW2011_GWF2_38_10]|nr:MAG: hypothetical protein US69_C0007G0003 [candidate division TM6 bacterium GW2011_GWF2_38_10]